MNIMVMLPIKLLFHAYKSDKVWILQYIQNLKYLIWSSFYVWSENCMQTT